MKLLITPTSPFARKARILIMEKTLDCAVETANAWEDDPQVLANNPLRRVPILLTDGGAIVESDVICEYLDSLAPPFFLPQDFAARMATKTRAAIAQGGLESAVAVLLAKRLSPQIQNNEDWRKWLLNKTEKAVAYFEESIATRDSQKPDMADITLFCFLDFITFRMPDINWQSENPNLAKWFNQTALRPSYTQTDPRT